jgi:DNA topoisomerase-3
LLATDAEREGEVIGAEILQYVGFNDWANAKRFWVSEALTKDVVLKGIKDAKPLSHYASYKEQGFARQTADWLVGLNPNSAKNTPAKFKILAKSPLITIV